MSGGPVWRALARAALLSLVAVTLAAAPAANAQAETRDINDFFVALAAKDEATVRAFLADDVSITSHYLGRESNESLALFLVNASGEELLENYHRISLPREYAVRGKYEYGATFGLGGIGTTLNVEVVWDGQRISALHSYYVGQEPPPVPYFPPRAPAGSEN